MVNYGPFSSQFCYLLLISQNRLQRIMSGMATPRQMAPRPMTSRPRQRNVDDEIQAAFRDFRESAVRLAEQVTDLRGAPEDPVAAAQANLRLLRTVFSKWSPDVLVALH